MSLVGYGAFDHRNMNFPSNCKIRENIANFTITFRREIYQGQSFLEVRSSKEKKKILASQSRETNRTGRKSSIQGQPALWTRHKKARVAPYVQLTSGGDWRASTSPSAGASLLYAVSPLARWYALYFVKVYFLQIKICNYLYYIYKRRLRAREDENKFINERLSSMALV